MFERNTFALDGMTDEAKRQMQKGHPASGMAFFSTAA